MRHFSIFWMLLISTIACGEANLNKDEPKFKILKLDRKVTFFEDDGLVKAKMHVVMKIRSLSNVSFDFEHFEFIDSYSKIENVRKDKKRYTPAISDFVQDGIFYNDLEIAQFRIKFDQKNEVVIKYDKVFNDYKMLDLIYFHNFSCPVAHSIASIEIPEWLDASIKEFNFENFEIKKSSSKLKKGEEFLFETFDLEMPERFESAPSRGKVFPHLMFILNGSQHEKTDKKLMPSLNELYAWYYSLVSKVSNDRDVLQTYLDKIVDPNDNDLDKIKSVYYWIQDNIRYIAFEYGIMGFKPETCQDVIKQKYGDCKGMANLMKEMLKMLGYDARLCWLGTTDVAYEYDTPTVYADNHMICMVNFNGERIFLDGTQKYTGLNNFSQGIQGRPVLIEDGENFILDKIPSFEPGHNKFANEINLKIDGDLIVGSGHSQMTGDQVSDYLNIVNSQTDFEAQELLSYYLSYDPKNVICEIDVENDDYDRDENIEFDYSIKLKNRITDLGDEIYLNPEIRHDYSGFKLEDDRSVDYDLGSKKIISFETSIEIPNGFNVSYMPESIAYDSSTATFDLSYQKSGTAVIYKKSITVKNNILPVDEFQNWNSFLEQLSDFYSDQLIFSKL